MEMLAVFWGTKEQLEQFGMVYRHFSREGLPEAQCVLCFLPFPAEMESKRLITRTRILQFLVFWRCLEANNYGGEKKK
jgi:hypothetical protein